MTTPAAGIAYLLWLRLRLGATLTLAYLACLAVGVQLYPNAGEAIVLPLFSMVMGVAHLLQVFTIGPADFGVKSSGYPANMFVLPLRTRALSGWPILFGSLAFGLLWVLIAYLVLRPAGFSPPVVWPAVFAATTVAWIQAISWTSFPTPFARVPALAIALEPLILLGMWAGMYPDSRLVAALVTVLCLAWLAAAYGFAIHGLARARCGAEWTWSFMPERLRSRVARWRAAANNTKPPFRSPSTAQLWHECRRNTYFMPAMLAFIGLPLLAMNCLWVLDPNTERTLLFGTVKVPPAVMNLALWITLPLLLAATIGQGLGKFDFWGKEQIPGFFAIRPMTTARFVWLKLVAALLMAVVTWTIILIFLAILALVETSPLNSEPSVVRAALENLTPLRLAASLGVLLGLVAITWRATVNGMWTSFLGRKSAATVCALASWGVLLVAGMIGTWVYRHPEVQARLIDAVPWLLGALLVLKFGAAAGACYWIIRLKLLGPQMVAWLAGLWLAVAGGLFTLLAYVGSLSWLLAGTLLLVMPLTRIAFCPLALFWNRHR